MPSVIAVTSRPQTLETGGYREAPRAVDVADDVFLPALAARLDTTVYELRARLAGSPPWPVARIADPWEADAVCAWLRNRGGGAVLVPLERLRGIAAARSPMALGPDGLTLGAQTLPYARIAFMVDALNVVEHASERVEHVIVSVRSNRMPQTADIASVRYSKDRQRVLYLFDDGGGVTRVAQELTRSLALPGVTSLARYEALCEGLRARAPHAGFDARLVRAPRRRTSYEPTQHDHDHSTLRSDNVDETDLAALALHLASVEGQRLG